MGDEGKAVGCVPLTALLFERDTQYKISKIKFAISMMAVTPATESNKASLASWWPANRSAFMTKARFGGCRDPDTRPEGRMGFVMGQALFNTKPHSRSASRQTQRPSLTRRFALRSDLTKFACFNLPNLVEARPEIIREWKELKDQQNKDQRQSFIFWAVVIAAAIAWWFIQHPRG
jgi:hypothetical protein